MHLTPALSAPAIGPGKATFPGILRSELYKALRLRAMPIGAVLVIIPSILTALFLLASNYVPTSLAAIPPTQKGAEGYFIESLFEHTLELIRDFSGIFLLVLAVLVVGQEFQNGTIRVILARGVDRTQWLLAKVLTLCGIALGMIAVYLAVIFALTYVAIAHATGGTAIFQHLPQTFGYDMWMYVVSTLLNAAATIMMAVAATIIGRSPMFGIGVALIFFPADTILVTIFGAFSHVFNSDFWTSATGYLLGPSLNALPISLIIGNHMTPDSALRVAVDGTVPDVFYDGTHAVLVVLTYTVVFAAISIILLRRRDVQE